MRHSVRTGLVLCAIAASVVPVFGAEQINSSTQPHPVVGQTETTALLQRLTGTLVMTEPVGGINALDLATLTYKSIRPANAGRAAIHTLSEPDMQGNVMLVSGIVSAERSYTVRIVNGDNEKTLFTGPGDPLWDNAISPISLSPTGTKAAFVAQPPENEGRQFRPLVKGPLRLWDATAAAVRDLGSTALGERASWFPDGRMLAYAADPSTFAANDTRPAEPVVRLLDTSTGESSLLASGHLPLVSSDGRSVLVTRGRNFELVLVDVQTRTERIIPRKHGLGTPIALIDSRYLIYKGKPTPGAPTGETSNNSPLVGPKPMMAIKLMDLENGQFVTLIPLIDPRRSVTALAHAAATTAQ